MCVWGCVCEVSVWSICVKELKCDKGWQKNLLRSTPLAKWSEGRGDIILSTHWHTSFILHTYSLFYTQRIHLLTPCLLPSVHSKTDWQADRPSQSDKEGIQLHRWWDGKKRQSPKDRRQIDWQTDWWKDSQADYWCLMAWNLSNLPHHLLTPSFNDSKLHAV